MVFIHEGACQPLSKMKLSSQIDNGFVLCSSESIPHRQPKHDGMATQTKYK
ncbi:hypothetical protein MTBLM5_140015 [Magnetospirillum sp. LM-5]|nr:hypothetical protein MTBLM5_140015 [Magnetospirillum sp. LM-5]